MGSLYTPALSFFRPLVLVYCTKLFLAQRAPLSSLHAMFSKLLKRCCSLFVKQRLRVSPEGRHRSAI